MNAIFRQLEAADDSAALCAELSELLGLTKPVPEEVLARARADDHYANYLLRSRGHPDLLEVLLRSPGNAAYRNDQSATAETASTDTLSHSNLALAAKAGAAALKWAAGGFKQIPQETLERRLAACEACPNLMPAPGLLIYKVALSSRSDQRICGACGCTASRKASLPDEACPVEDPDQPGFTRWQEPIKAKA
ncbi:hypothetical protein [Caulobacter sp.]|uniref:hypothetical protein n=1 Tax=Caulobacter sp. TaxID=78 RepID=UPI001B17840B|nr:hypothetical protein [Caulobacter sp.]MBO9545434.1 hypothetical protein [Caulobacter sp.]